MNPEHNKPQPTKTTAPDCQSIDLSEHQLSSLDDPQKQEDYRRAYLLQQARQRCPGCGDDNTPF